MDDPVVIAAAIVTVVIAVAGAIVKIIDSLAKMKTDIITELNKAKEVQTEIHRSVNSNAKDAADKLAFVEGELARLNAQMIALQELRIEEGRRITNTQV